jgi:arylsulfatase A-like enzyme
MMDVLPTFAELAETHTPNDRKIDGVSMLPLFTETSPQPIHETFLYYYGHNLEAVRRGEWKLRLASSKEKDANPQLYNLVMDIGESSDVSAVNPEIVKQLMAIAEGTKGDLGMSGMGPGCRELGRVQKAGPLIDREGKIRNGLEPDQTRPPQTRN